MLKSVASAIIRTSALSMKVSLFCTIDEFRRFLIESTCASFIPQEYLRRRDIFPERRQAPGRIYVEAEFKEELEMINDIVFVAAKNPMGIIYESKSGRSRLKWRQISESIGKLEGEITVNTLVNLITARINVRPENIQVETP